jgi:hypothetical protein
MHFPMNRFDAARRGRGGVAAPPSRVARLAPSELMQALVIPNPTDEIIEPPVDLHVCPLYKSDRISRPAAITLLVFDNGVFAGTSRP